MPLLWIWRSQLQITITATVLEILESLFLEYWYLIYLRSEGRPQFRTELSEYCKAKHITHELTSPYNPESNFLTEAAVKNLKSFVIRCDEAGEDLGQAIATWWNMVRTDWSSLAQMFFNRTHSKKIAKSQPQCQAFWARQSSWSENSDKLQFWQIPILTNSNSDKLRFWQIPFLTNSNSDKFQFWQIPILTNSNSDNFQFWQIPILTNSDSENFKFWQFPISSRSGKNGFWQIPILANLVLAPIKHTGSVLGRLSASPSTGEGSPIGWAVNSMYRVRTGSCAGPF